MMDEVNDLAGQHEVVAENLQANVIKEISALVKDLREERKVGSAEIQTRFFEGVSIFFFNLRNN